MKKIIFLLLVFTFTLLGNDFDGVIHLHVNNFKKVYNMVDENPVVNSFFAEKSFSVFKESKLYLRLADELNAINSGNNIFTDDFLKKLDEKPFDLYLMDIGTLNFLAKIELNEVQLISLTSIDLSKLTFATEKGYKIYKKENIFLCFVKDKNVILVSNSDKNIKDFILNKNKYETLTLKEGFENFMYIDMSKVNQTPYLTSYWFTKDSKQLENVKNISVYFNADEKNFTEKGEIVYEKKDELKFYNKELNINSSITLLNILKSFEFTPFPADSNLHLYQRVYDIDKKSELILGNFNGDIESLKALLLKSNSAIKFTEIKSTDNKTYFELNYGLMNKDVVYFKLEGNLITISQNKDLINTGIKENQNLQYVKIDKKGFSFIKEMLKKQDAVVPSQNFTYSEFLNNFLSLYFDKLETFEYSLSEKEGKFEFFTKILF